MFVDTKVNLPFTHFGQMILAEDLTTTRQFTQSNTANSQSHNPKRCTGTITGQICLLKICIAAVFDRNRCLPG